MNVPLIVDPEGNTPLYQQLKYQLIYLIGSRQLPVGQQLPAIRELSDSLQINIGTVAQAYRELQSEGLIESLKGRGTFVRAVLPPHFTDETRAKQAILTNLLTETLTRASSLGFTANEIQQRIAFLLSRGLTECHLAFVGPTEEIAQKHALLVREHFATDGVQVHSLTEAALSRGELPAEFDAVYYVMTFVPLARAVENALATLTPERRVIPVSTRISDYTLGALAILPEDTRACLVAEERNLHSALNLVTTNSRLPRSLPTATPDESDRTALLCESVDVVIHSFSSRKLLDLLNVPPAKRLELRFEIDPGSLSDIRQLLPLNSRMPAGRA
ncbi:MAG: GntR family transcriptional regulator [Trueperaceae bacterium]